MVIIYEGGLNKYYARPSLAQFVERMTETARPTLDGHLLDSRWKLEDRYRDGITHKFYDLAFVDPQGYASVLSLRGESAAAVSRKIALAAQTMLLPMMVVRFHFVVFGNRPAHVEVAISPAQQGDVASAESFLTTEWVANPWVGV